MGILLMFRDLYIRLRNVNAFVAVPILLLDGVRVVRMRKRNGQAKGTGGGWTPSGGVEVSGGFEHNLFIKVELIRAYAGPGL